MSERVDFERLLGTQLRTYAEGGVRPVDRRAIAGLTITSGTAIRAARRRSTLRILGVAALLAIGIIAMLLVSAGSNPPPRLVVAPTSTPAPTVTTAATLEMTPTPSEPSHAGTAVALVARPVADPRAIDIVAIAVDGQERTIRHVEGAFEEWALVSNDGFVALSAPTGFTLFDLHNPSAGGVTVTANPHGRPASWGPNGLFATTAPGDPCQAYRCRIQVMDARTGQTTDLGVLDIYGCCPSIEWAADGSGILINAEDGVSTKRLDGSIIEGGQDVPDPLADAVMYCRTGETDCGDPRLSGEIVALKGPDGELEPWYRGELAPARLQQAIGSNDGKTVLLLLDRPDGDRYVAQIARMEAPGQATVIASFDVGGDLADLQFGPTSDDETVFVVQADYGPSVEPTSAIVWMVDTSGRVHVPDGFVSGLISAEVADAWPGGPFAPPAP